MCSKRSVSKLVSFTKDSASFPKADSNFVRASTVDRVEASRSIFPSSDSTSVETAVWLRGKPLVTLTSLTLLGSVWRRGCNKDSLQSTTAVRLASGVRCLVSHCPTLCTWMLSVEASTISTVSMLQRLSKLESESSLGKSDKFLRRKYPASASSTGTWRDWRAVRALPTFLRCNKRSFSLGK